MHHLLYGFLYVLSLLPMRVLYWLSDFTYFIIYHLAGYRKEVVRNNLQIAFPEKTEKERRKIEKQFYRNFVDNFIETLKLISGGSKYALKHFEMDGTLMEEEFRKGNKCQFHLGHNFNWELANIAVSAYTSYTMLGVYMPVRNKIVDAVMLKIRSISGTKLLPATNMKKAIYPFRSTTYLLALVADQVPGNVTNAYWLNFFGKPTPFMRGPEKGARAGNLSVVFAQIYKKRRGYYKLSYELFTSNPSSLEPGEITRAYVRYLEKVIREHPEMWLWSHRRWKKDWQESYAHLWIDTAPVPA